MGKFTFPTKTPFFFCPFFILNETQLWSQTVAQWFKPLVWATWIQIKFTLRKPCNI